jgi:hypothetical protein
LVTVDAKTVTATAVELIAADKPTENTAVETVFPTATVNCFQSTPLDNLEDAQALQQSLVTLGISESKRIMVQTQKVNYWVMIPADKDVAKVNDAIASLKQRRIKDFFIVRSGRYENAISLGVYSTRERAEQRYKEISKLKLRIRKPEIEALELPAKQLVVTFRLDSDESPEGLTALLESVKPPRLQKISCN